MIAIISKKANLSAERGRRVKARIWELDALRGLCILGMVIVHLLFDLVDVYALVSWKYPAVVDFLFAWGGVIFILISGICATLGSRSVRRGLVVFGCGVLCTAVTWGAAKLSLIDDWVVIRFGILHCLGICMILWWLFKRLPTPILVVAGLLFVGLGLWFATLWVPYPGAIALGLQYAGFTSGDYFPLFPNFGFFLLGSAIGRLIYKNKTSLLPKVNHRNPILRFFQFCGRESLWIYLLHQPLLAGLCMLLAML